MCIPLGCPCTLSILTLSPTKGFWPFSQLTNNPKGEDVRKAVDTPRLCDLWCRVKRRSRVKVADGLFGAMQLHAEPKVRDFSGDGDVFLGWAGVGSVYGILHLCAPLLCWMYVLWEYLAM